MLNTISMFGVKFRFHRSLYAIVSICICLVILRLCLTAHNNLVKEETLFDNDEDINLVDLFTNAFRLTYQAGNAIRLFKYAQNESRIFQKYNSIGNQSVEPVTYADLLSHSILNHGLKKLYKNLHIVSEEKTSIDDEQIRLLETEFHQNESPSKMPFIPNEKHLMNIPLSSVAVWIDPLDATQEFTENLLQYVMVMLCITVDHQPTIGILYAPFTDKLVWGWIDVNRSPIKPNQNNLVETHRPNIDEIVLSRSHAGRAHQILRQIYRQIPYQIIPAAGSGYKTVHLLEQYSDYYLHLTPIKKWDICAPDALLRSHHGIFTDLQNQTISYDHQSNEMIIKNGLLGTYKRNHNEILKIFTKSNIDQLMSSKPSKH